MKIYIFAWEERKKHLRPVWLVVLSGGNGNDLRYKISSKVSCHSHGDETFIIQKYFLLYKFPLPPNTTSTNGNALEWILWKKWDDWSWTNIAVKVAKRFFNQNYTIFHSQYHRLIPPTKSKYKMDNLLSPLSVCNKQWAKLSSAGLFWLITIA